MTKLKIFFIAVFVLMIVVACGGAPSDYESGSTIGESREETVQDSASAERPTIEVELVREVEVEVQSETIVVTRIVEVEGAAMMDDSGSSLPEIQEPLPTPYFRPDPEDPDTMIFEDAGTNPFVDTDDDNLSTFAIDVDTGAYTVMRRYISDGILPPAASVRTEEYVNYFDHGYETPADGAFSINIDGAKTPYNESDSYYLVRVGIQGYEVPKTERPNGLFIFVIDTSGSMDRENRLGLVKRSLTLLTENLNPNDRIGIIEYGSQARVVLNPTPIVAKGLIQDAIDQLHTNGSTNVEEGIQMAFRMADQFKADGEITRLIVASDGVANVGNTTSKAILEYARDGISLSTFGFGLGNYNDTLMEQLANQGDGTYAYIDSMDEAERVFVDDLTGTLFTIAKDAKIQVEFNEEVVLRYRLLGYENREVADSDFRNDAVDAGEIGSGHSVTALYEVKFDQDANPNTAALTVRVRYQDPDTPEVTELAQSIAQRDLIADWETADPSLQLAVIVAEYAEVLGRNYWARESSLVAISKDARRIAEYFPQDTTIQEFSGLVGVAASLAP